MARSLALDENNQPILVEYNEQGEEVSVVSIPDEYKTEVAKLKVITAFEYHQEKARLDKFEELHKEDLWKDAEVMALDQFKETEFTSADGRTIIKQANQNAPSLELRSYVKSVLVRGRSARINQDPDELILLSFSVDLSEEETVPETGSLVINDKGQVIHSSTNNIAPRVGFFGDPNETQDFYQGLRKPEDQIFGPVKYVKVYISPEVFPGSLTASDFRGKYSMSFMLPYCPGGFEYTTDIWAELRYANFSPYGSPTIPYYLRRQDWTYCYDLPPFSGGTLGAAMAYTNAMAINATTSIPVYNIDFKVDVMFLSGRILLKNPDGSEITIGNDTQYHVTAAGNESLAQAFYDFDGDGQSDRSVVGDIRDEVADDGSIKKIFVQQQNGPYQGVFFSSQSNQDGTPNVIRLADKGDRNKPNGLLKSISKDDLKNTDIYVFRESTGQLVLERNGLKDEEIAGRVDIGLGKDDQYYYYRLMLRGPMDNQLNVGAINRSKNWEEWAEEYRLAEPFRERESDYLKSGEWVRLVVINRATGYMGTQRIQLGDASKNAGSMLSVKMDDTYLQPPNLKIWAERDYTQTSGLNQGDQLKNNIIGMEGASLDTDDIIRVYTEWLDEEGRPLPEGLGADNGEQYGLTGRLAKVGAPNQLVGVAAGSLANFPIAPGMNTQVLRLRDNLTAPEHFYVHVVGMQKDENPDFGTDPTEAPPLDTRPKNATPFLVPIYDENKHWKTWSAWNQLKRAYDAEELDEEPLKPKGSYVWHARPEYQFSQLALEIQKIEREYTTESGEIKTQELLVEQEDEGKIPTIRANDDLVRVFYSLIGNSNNPLLPIDGEQELVFGFGASEVRATIGANGEIVFDDLSHIDRLDPTDLLTLRLYVNHDAGNTLWEWAFTRNGLHVYYQVPGNTQLEKDRSLANIGDNKCSNNVCEDIEILSLLAPQEQPSVATPLEPVAQPNPIVRTLGGIRLRYRYIAPSLNGIVLKKVTWTIGHAGRYCTEYGIDSAACEKRETGIAYEQEGGFRIPGITPTLETYWEPLNGDNPDWSNWAGTETDSAGVKGLLEAEYTVPVNSVDSSGNTVSIPATRYFKKEFTIKTRELKPATGTESPMQGSDVAMLEAMLWNLGMSPDDKKGIYGRRIASVQQRSVFNVNTPSVGRMLGRFNYISFLPIANNRSHMTMTDVTHQDGNRESVLPELGRHWQHYYKSYKFWRFDDVNFADLSETQLSAATDVWNGSVVYSEGSSFTLSPTYTSARHANVVALAGKNFKESDILRAMAQREASGIHQSDYRITVGGADEAGSKGLNQILNKYVYGSSAQDAVGANARKADKEVSGYSESGSSQVNHYDARDNLIAKAVWLAVPAGGFNKAFVNRGTGVTSFTGIYTWAVTNPLRKILPGGAPIIIASNATQHIDDDYELLAKGLGAYNQGAARFSGGIGSSWINVLVNRPTPTSEAFRMVAAKDYGNRSESEKVLFSLTEAVRYAMWIMHDSDKLALPMRTYVWKGGEGVDVNGDGEIKNVPANPAANPVQAEIIEETVEWCFAYGESDWVGGVSWEDKLNNAKAIDEFGGYKLPVGRASCN
ncbi:hypothetical protein [Cellvibrio sp. NN19]|uniref:hypothetical protein n=1 Tax=Cellvibrio chitinivorans TaxID=3102792 RepID=UPI002B4145D6|nr:hypothetical protein [Cellvibrio sp. NN19]